MYSFHDFEPFYCFMYGFNYCFLICIQISQETGKVVWYSQLFKDFPQFVVIHTVRGFNVVNEEVDVFLELSCFFYDPTDVGNLISGFSAFSKSGLYFWKLLVHILLKPSLENLGITLLACEMIRIVQQFKHSLALPFFGIGMKTTFFSSVATADFSKFAGILSAALSQHHLAGFEIAQLEFHHLH